MNNNISPYRRANINTVSLGINTQNTSKKALGSLKEISPAQRPPRPKTSNSFFQDRMKKSTNTRPRLSAIKQTTPLLQRAQSGPLVAIHDGQPVGYDNRIELAAYLGGEDQVSITQAYHPEDPNKRVTLDMSSLKNLTLNAKQALAGDAGKDPHIKARLERFLDRYDALTSSTTLNDDQCTAIQSLSNLFNSSSSLEVLLPSLQTLIQNLNSETRTWLLAQPLPGNDEIKSLSACIDIATSNNVDDRHSYCARSAKSSIQRLIKGLEAEVDINKAKKA